MEAEEGIKLALFLQRSTAICTDHRTCQCLSSLSYTLLNLLSLVQLWRPSSSSCVCFVCGVATCMIREVALDLPPESVKEPKGIWVNSSLWVRLWNRCPEGLWTLHRHWRHSKLKWTRPWANITSDLSLLLLRIAMGTLIGVDGIVWVWKHQSNNGRRTIRMAVDGTQIRRSSR